MLQELQSGRYSIDENGIVFDHFSKTIINSYPSTLGYRIINLYIVSLHRRKTFLLQTLIMEYRNIPKPSKYHHIKHIDNNKLNCAFSNLEWTDEKRKLKPQPKSPTILCSCGKMITLKGKGIMHYKECQKLKKN